MGRYAKYGKGDAPQAEDGDTGFVAVNAKIAPDLLAAGNLAYAQNVRLNKGVAETRGGIITPGHFNGPLSVDAIGNVTSWRWNRIFGSGVYSNPDAAGDPTPTAPEQWTVLATDTGVWVTADGFSPMAIALPPGESITGPVTFEEAQNTLLMFRGIGFLPLEWSGDIGTAWNYIVSAEVTNSEGEDIGILGMPNAAWAVYLANRLFVPVPSGSGPGGQPATAWPQGGLTDQLAVSDILDFTHFAPAQDEFAINSGADEELVAVVPYNGSVGASLICFKERSIWWLDNLSGDLTQTTLSPVSQTLGCKGRLSCAQVGADIFFLCESPAGVYRLNQVIQQTIQAAPVPVSDPIEPVIRRIHWAAADGAAGVLYGDYYYLAVPLDGSAINNAILVYNTVGGTNGAGAWESIDTLPAGVGIDEWLITNWRGGQRLFGIDHTNGRVYLYGEGNADRFGSAPAAGIPMSITTRGYGASEALDVKAMRRVYVAVSRWNPNYSVSLNTEAAEASETLTVNRTVNPAVSLIWGKGQWNTTNANGDFARAGRADYAMRLPMALQPGGGPATVKLNIEQEVIERFVTRSQGRFGQLTISCTQGKLTVRAAGIEGDQARRGVKETQ